MQANTRPTITREILGLFSVRQTNGIVTMGVANMAYQKNSAVGSVVFSIIKLAVFVNFADVASFEGGSTIGKRIAGPLIKGLFG